MGKRIITTEATEEDARIEGSLRPTRLADYTGQKRLVDNLKIYIVAMPEIFIKSCHRVQF